MLIVIGMLLHLQAYAAGGEHNTTVSGRSQGTGFNKSVALKMEKTPAVQIIEYLENIADITVSYSDSVKDILAQPVSLNKERITVVNALKHICALTGTRIEILKKSAVIRAADTQSGGNAQSEPEDDEIVANVNSEPVTRREIERQLTVYSPFLDKNDKAAQKIYKGVLQRVILMKVRNQFIRKSLKHHNVSKKKIRKHVGIIKKRIEKDDVFKDFKAFLTGFGYANEEEYISNVVIPDLKYKQFLNNLVSEKDMRDVYNRRKEDIKQIRVSHIFLKKTGREIEDSKIKIRAEKIRNSLVNGADFAETAQKHSDAESASKGGDIGYMSGDSKQVHAEIKQAVLSMKQGDISDVISLSEGFHIVTVTDVRETYAEVKDIIRKSMIMQLQQRHIQELLQKSRIDIRDDTY